MVYKGVLWWEGEKKCGVSKTSWFYLDSIPRQKQPKNPLNPHISHTLHYKTLLYPKIVYELFGFFIFMTIEWFTIFHERLKCFFHKTNSPSKYLKSLKVIDVVTPCTLTQSVDSKLSLLYNYLFLVKNDFHTPNDAVFKACMQINQCWTNSDANISKIRICSVLLRLQPL